MLRYAANEPNAGVGDVTPAQKTLLSVFALFGAAATGAVVGQVLGGKEWALTGGIVAPVVVLVAMAQRGAGGA